MEATLKMCCRFLRKKSYHDGVEAVLMSNMWHCWLGELNVPNDDINQNIS